MIQQIHTVSTVTHTGDGWWQVLLPALIAAIPSTAAIVFSWSQSRRSTRLAQNQLNASNLAAMRQAEISDRQTELLAQKQIHEARSELYDAWKALNDSAWKMYMVYLNDDRSDKGYTVTKGRAYMAFEEASLRMRFLFADDVVTKVESLKDALEEAYKRRLAFERMELTADGDNISQAYSDAEKSVRSQIDEVREAVRAYTVYELGRN